jgi:hypothetical protein
MEKNTPIIGAEIVSLKDETGIIIDKARGYCNGSSPTIYVCMSKDGTVFEVDYNDIKEIKRFITHPESDYSKYLDKK